MGLIAERFVSLRKENRKAFIPYIPFGFPSIPFTKKIILLLQEAGADLIELGLPFSDPLADGPILQEASRIALTRGATSARLFSFLKKIKPKLRIPLLIMTYINPVQKYGLKSFLKDAGNAGVSGVMVVDLPIEESKEFIAHARRFNLDTIFFVTPTTNPKRIKKIVSLARGFIYYISVTGITGPKSLNIASVKKHIARIRSMTKTPVCVGFGIHTRGQVKRIQSLSDGAIVGSAITNYICKHYKQRGFTRAFSRFIQSLQP